MRAGAGMTDIETRIIEYALALPGAYLDHPFHDDIVTVRHGNNKKIFVFILHRSGQIWVNLKSEPMKADFWRGVYQSVTRGYHMNDKASWNTVIMDGSVPWDILKEMISDSYDLTKSKPKGVMRHE